TGNKKQTYVSAITKDIKQKEDNFKPKHKNDEIDAKKQEKSITNQSKQSAIIKHVKQNEIFDESNNKNVENNDHQQKATKKSNIPKMNPVITKSEANKKEKNEDFKPPEKEIKSASRKVAEKEKVENINTIQEKNKDKGTKNKDKLEVVKPNQHEIKIKEEPKNVEKKTDAKKKENNPTLKPNGEHKQENERVKRSDKEPAKKDKISRDVPYDSREMYSKSEAHLKHVTDALQRRNLLQSEFEDFYAFFPTFAPNFSRIHNPECRRHGQIVLRQLRGTKLWAFNMLDATAKIPSGLLQGNGIQLGDFDQCVGSRARVQLESGSVVRVQGQYCLARLDVKAEHPELELPVHLAQAKNIIKSRIDDPGHFVPRFSTLSWGVCVPSACDPEDVEVVIRDALKHYQHTTGLVLRVKVDSEDCHVHKADWWEDWLELPTVLTLSLYVLITLLVLTATAQDFFSGIKNEKQQNDGTEDEAECDQKETNDEELDDAKTKKDSVISSFSLYRSVSKLVAPGTDDDIACIHGVRGLATLALLIAHKFLPVAVMPYTNRLKIAEVVSSPLWSWCRAGWVFTDCFLLLSGTLMAHRADGDTSVPRRLFSRYLRLTPALLAVVLFYAYVWDYTSEGPMWGTLVTKNAEVCQQGWWWNIFYVQNYFGFEEMCAPQTHQLALDMQLTILGSVIVWAIQSDIAFSKYSIPALMSVAAYSRYKTAQEHRLTMIAYHGVSVSQLYRTARLSYTSSLHRCTPYLVGVSLGLALRKPSQHGKIMLAFGWLTSILLWAAVWWAGFDSGSTRYRYDASVAAQYATLAPFASSISIAWLIYTVHSGQCEWVSRLLCCRFLALISRLSYALYLTQFIVFLTNAATVRSSSEFTLLSLIDAQEISAVLLTSTILTLTFVIPMQSLHKMFSCSLYSKSENANKTEPTEKKREEIENSTQNTENDVEEIIDVPPMRRQHFMAHREVLEEIPEVEIEYEMQRDKEEGLEEILEEEEGEEFEDRLVDDDELEIIEEEQGGEDEVWEERDAYLHRRSFSRNEDNQDLDEWEWTNNGNDRNGAQNYRYLR
ncbi:hypothetical protein ACJJTC_003417, partial [Scirpophaga incertulas]